MKNIIERWLAFTTAEKWFIAISSPVWVPLFAVVGTAIGAMVLLMKAIPLAFHLITGDDLE